MSNTFIIMYRCDRRKRTIKPYRAAETSKICDDKLCYQSFFQFGRNQRTKRAVKVAIIRGLTGMTLVQSVNNNFALFIYWWYLLACYLLGCRQLNNLKLERRAILTVTCVNYVRLCCCSHGNVIKTLGCDCDDGLFTNHILEAFYI